MVDGGEPVSGLYVVGWIKRGPSGVIGTNKPGAFRTAKHLLSDAPSLPPCEEPRRESLRAMLEFKGIRFVDYEAWKRVDAAEIERGKALGKPREKFVTVESMLEAAGC